MSHLVRPKDALETTKQDGVVYKIPCECGKVYIGETGRAMQDRIKEHDRDTELYGLLVRKLPQFQSTLTKRGVFLFGKKLSLLIVTLTGQARLLGFFEDTSSTAPLRLKRLRTNHS